MPAHNAAEDTQLLVATLRDAGQIARHYFGNACKSWRKSSGDPVTEADIAVDTFLKNALLAARPNYGWLSEETADNSSRLSSPHVFIVDPIDGTYGFLKRLPHFTIVAAVVTGGRPFASAIYNPLTEEMFEATFGNGSKLNGKVIHVGEPVELDHARILAARDVMDPQRWVTPWPASITIENRASIAYRMTLVACGAFDAMISPSTKADWDMAAGDLIVHEAGGCVTTAKNEQLIYNKASPMQGSVVAAEPVLQARLIERMHEYKLPLPNTG